MRPPCLNGRDQCNTGSLALCISSLTLVSPAVVVVKGQQDAQSPKKHLNDSRQVIDVG